MEPTSPQQSENGKQEDTGTSHLMSSRGFFSTSSDLNNNNNTSSSSSFAEYQRRVDVMLEGINVDRLANLVNESRKQAELAKDKGLILLVGRTGAGKSTLLNYLMGLRLVDASDGGLESKLKLAPGQTPYAEIGSELTSQTLHPQVVPTREHQKELAYCDCPGFDDNRLKEEKLCSTIGVPMAISYAKSVCGLIIVIDCADLTATKGEGVVLLANVLLQLLKNPETALSKDKDSITRNFLFVFTKVPADRNLSHILKTLEDKRKSIEKQIQKLNIEAEQILAELSKLTGMSIAFSEATTEQLRESLMISAVRAVSALSGEASLKGQSFIKQLSRIKEEFSHLIGHQYIFQAILSSHENCFIIRGNEKDDKPIIINKISQFLKFSPIPKEEFILSGSYEGAPLIFDKIIEKIVDESGKLFHAEDKYVGERSSLKKYLDLVETQQGKENQDLQKLKLIDQKSGNLTQKDLDSIVNNLNEVAFLINFINAIISNKEQEKGRLQKELDVIDTSEPVRYEHRSLDPITFNRRIAAILGTGAALFAPAYVVGMPIILALGLVTAFAGVGSQVMSYLTGKLISLTTNTLQLILRRSHHFHYSDLPFISIQRKCDPPNLYKEISPKDPRTWSFGLSVSETAGQSLFSDDDFVADEEGGFPNGFDIKTEVVKPPEGKYEITYRNSTSGQFNSRITVWIELFVEKRLHPQFRSRIALLKHELLLPESKMLNILRADLKYLKQALANDQALLKDSNGDSELQKSLVKILEKRIDDNKKRIQDLRTCYDEYENEINKIKQELQKHQAKFELVKQLLIVMPTKNLYVNEIMLQYQMYQLSEGKENLGDSSALKL